MIAVPATLRASETAAYGDAIGGRLTGPDPVTGHVTETRLDRTSLVLASERARGVRLSDVLRMTAAQKIHLDISSALAAVRLLVAVVSDLEDQTPGIAVGPITPERIIIVRRERVPAASATRAQPDGELLWRQFRLALETGLGSSRSTHRTNVLNTGLVALALVLGRELQGGEFPRDVAFLLDAARERSTLGYERPVSKPVREWLARTLQLDPQDAFATASEARVALDEIVSADPLYLSSPLALEILYDSYEEALSSADGQTNQLPSGNAYRPARPVAQMAGPDGASAALPTSAALRFLTDREIVAEMLPPSPITSEAEGWTAPSEAIDARAIPDSRPSGAVSFGLFRRDACGSCEADAPDESRRATVRITWRTVATAAGVVGLLAGGVALTRAFSPSVAAAYESGTLTVHTKPAGMLVLVDGIEHGRAPLRREVPAGRHLLEVRSGVVSRRIPFTLKGGAEFSQSLEFDTAPVPASSSPQSPDRLSAPLTPAMTTRPAAAPAWGWLAIKSSALVEVRLDGKVIGTSELKRIRMSPGEHEIELVNRDQAYRTLRVVSVAPGRVTSLGVSLPAAGLVNVNASPWAEVWIGGRRVGETPLANVSVPVGRHEVVFRHPQLGEKRQSISVTAGPPLRLSMDMR